MIIKRDKDYKIYCFMLVFTCVFLILVYIFGKNAPLHLALLLHSPVFLFIILSMIAMGRTFVLDKNGIIVCFWKYRKTYTWNQLQTKRIETYNLPPIGRIACPYTKEAIFSPYKIHKPKAMHSSFYSIFHPFSYIFINFSPENKKYQTGRYYEIEESVFWEKIQEWGIDM